MGLLRSFRGDGPWKGRTTRGGQDRGERRLRLVEGGYVSSDGHEIRAMPGFHTLWDGTSTNNDNGFERKIVDSRRPVFDWTQSTSLYQYENIGSQQTVISFAKATHLHGFDQVRGRLQIYGESDFRRNPIYNASRAEPTLVGIHITSSWNLQLDSTPAAYSTTDTGAAGGNGLATGDVVYVEIDSVESPWSPYALHEVDHLFGVVAAIVADTGHPGKAFITLQTASAGPLTGSPRVATGRVFRTRCNRSDIYPVSPYEPIDFKQIDDPEALTLWTVVDGLDLDHPCTIKAQPAWVANRQRDHGDSELASSFEGVQVTPGVNRSISRRFQKSLPYRLNPEVAGNRLILAAPGYGCLFQCPVIIPTAGENWPSPLEWSPGGGPGLIHWFNDVHDKPRALGLPKAILVDSIWTPVPTTTPAWTAPYNFLSYAISAGNVGWPAGIYRFAITYYDDSTGEEGLASEEVVVTIPTPAASISSAYSYGLQLVYIHPGYWFPECLALSINVYMATNTTEELAFYKRISLLDTAGTSTPNASAKYGTVSTGTPEDATQVLYRIAQLAPPVNTSSLTAARDETRAAPLSLQMPRGGECFRQIRGIGLTVGSSGFHGKTGEFLFTYASSVFNHTTPGRRVFDNEILIRGAGTPALDLSTPSTTRDGPFGIGSRYFPPAYTGVGLVSEDLYPAPRRLAFVDRMLNMRTHNTGGALDRQQAYEQRLRMDERIWDKDKSYTDTTFTPAAGSPFIQTRRGKNVYMMEPKGQVLVSEPGRPEVMIDTAIQIIDPNQDDDGIAIGNFGGGAVICTKLETFILHWYRAPQGNVPQLVSNEHGCIATNSILNYDGGLAWLAERGPVAMTADGFQWVGEDLEYDFHGASRRYATDSKGLMRHACSVHDRSRGLVLWGLVTETATHQISYKGRSVTFAQADDFARSRFPCDEVLIWSYRVGAFSRWRPPSGLEVKWMRILKDKNGDARLCFLAADNRIYAFDDEWSDTNRTLFTSNITGIGHNTTSVVLSSVFAVDGNGGATARGTGENLVRAGMSAVVYDSDGEVIVKSTVVSATVSSQTVVLADAATWGFGATIEIGHRSDLRVVTTFAGDSADNMDVLAVHARYTLAVEGKRAYVKVNAVKTELRDSPTEPGFSEEPSEWRQIGLAQAEPIGMRRALAEGRAVAPEIGVDITFMGGAQVRLTDLMLEMVASE